MPREKRRIDSALARPANRAAYAKATVFDLAAAYAFGIVRDHPFVDANKRVAFLAAALFLLEHDLEVTASDAAVVTAILSLAEDSMDEGSFAAWLHDNTTMSGEAKS
jgi:death-on-curing protein